VKLRRFGSLWAVALIAVTVTMVAKGQGNPPMKTTVLEAQQRLRSLGYEPGGADGVMGTKTIAALKNFQSNHGLPSSGVPDEKTMVALKAEQVKQDTEKAAKQTASDLTARFPDVVEGDLAQGFGVGLNGLSGPVVWLISHSAQNAGVGWHCEGGTEVICFEFAMTDTTIVPVSWRDKLGDPVRMKLGHYSVRGKISGTTITAGEIKEQSRDLPLSASQRTSATKEGEEKQDWEAADSLASAEAYITFQGKYPDTRRIRILSGKVSSGFGLDHNRLVGSVLVNGEQVASGLTSDELVKLGLADQSGGSISAKTLPNVKLIMKNVGGAWKIAAVAPAQ
jgi:hypothetical protein